MSIQLNAEQQKAVALAVSLKHKRGVGIVSGAAGTGKTSLTKALVAEVGNVKMIAPTNRAAQRASKLSGHPASTFHAWIYKIAHDAEGNTVFMKKAPEEIDPPSSGLIVIDEASMVSPDLWYDILEVADVHNCGILLIGDYFQLPPVMPRGETFTVFSDDFRDMVVEQGRSFERVDLVHVFRQAAESPIIRAATELRKYPSDWKNAVNIIQNAPSHDNDLEEGYGFPHPLDLSSKVFKLTEAGVDHCAIVFTNQVRHEVNRNVREYLGYSEGSDPQIGEPLLVRKNCHKANVSNGEIIRFTGFIDKQLVGLPPSWRFTKVNETEVLMSIDVLHGGEAPKYETLRGLPYPFLEANFGYGITCHAAQGSQWSTVIVNWETSLIRVLPPSMRIRWFYTALTRGESRVMISGLN